VILQYPYVSYEIAIFGALDYFLLLRVLDWVPTEKKTYLGFKSLNH
jgi:hypothetical protein